tara:strand:+ start:139 stop:408 length:270 start_codon:yes stop_codon:yes gene_type:complete
MVFKRWQKSIGKKPPEKSWTNEEMKIISWCLNKNIKVAITPDWEENASKWLIEININNKIHKDPNKYDNETVYNKVNEYYKYYYDKYNI